MNCKQLSVLLLAVSMVATQPVRGGEVKSGPSAKKQRPVMVKTVKPGPSKPKAKKSRGIKVNKKDSKASNIKMNESIAKFGKFDARGSIKSFTDAANNIIEFMNEKGSSATASQKAEIFTVIARFNWITGKKNFDTPAHIAETERLLNEASKHEALFGAAKMKFINKWKVTPRRLTAKKKQIAKAPIKKASIKNAPIKKTIQKPVVRKTVTPKRTATTVK